MQFVAENQAVLILAALAVLALLVGFALLRRPDGGLAGRLAAAEAEAGSLRARLDEQRIAGARLETERDGLVTRIAALADEFAAEGVRLSDRERDVSGLKVAETRLTGDCEKLKDDCRKLVEAYEKLEAKLQVETEAVKARDRRLGEVNGTVQELSAMLNAEREKYAVLNEDLATKSQQFVAQFKAISGEIIQNQGKATTEAQKAELEKIITPFKVEIDGLRTNLKDITEKAERERQSLGTQLLVMQTRAADLAEEANGLARALRGNAKKQGNWGETILERILEAAGLQEGTHFTRQAHARTEDGSRLIPDIVVRLPGERDIVIDSKVTLVAYQDMVQAADAEAEAAALRRHVQAVRAHVRGLSEKRYDALGFDSVDSVMMFLPVDGALTAALAAEPDLIVEAAEKRVHLMTPATLMPTLKIVEHLWTIDTRNRSVDEIVTRAGLLHDKFVSVVESIQRIGEHLKKASDCQDDAMKRMVDGSGNVIGQMDKLRQLGAKARKAMPAGLLVEAGVEDEDEAPELAPAPALTAG